MRKIRILGMETMILGKQDAISYLKNFLDIEPFTVPGILMLPERWINHVFNDGSNELDHLLDLFGEVSETLGAIFVPGSLSIRRKDGIYNTSPVLFGRRIIGWQDKLVPFGREVKRFSRGRVIKVFSASEFSFAVEICYDLNFPFMARIQSLRGADVILNPSLIRKEGIGMWHIYIRARSLENRIPIVSMNSSSEIFGGGSITTVLKKKPWGVLLSVRRSRNGIIDHMVDLDSMRELRSIRLSEDPGVYALGSTHD